MDEVEKSEKPVPERVPAIFATIHFKSAARPDGYSAGDIEEMNRAANDTPTDR